MLTLIDNGHYSGGRVMKTHTPDSEWYVLFLNDIKIYFEMASRTPTPITRLILTDKTCNLMSNVSDVEIS